MTYFGGEELQRHARGLPDQAQRLDRDPRGLGPQRRSRPVIAVAVGAAVVALFVVILALGGGENSPSPEGGIVVDGPDD
jgi:hypothetical protein